jgi:murein DD-endopeptidase MepM/ murein hydrolase activator NlpD
MPARARSTRRWRLPVGAAIWLAGIVGLTMASPVDAAPPCWFPPVEGTVTDPFREPPCRWCAGNRGIEFDIGDDVAVRAAASGRVEFVGSVADVRYVVVRLTNGWRHTYGQLTSTSLELGGVVLAGGVVGRASRMFFFGLRIGDDYADPAPFIGALRGRPRLIPVDATPARPAPPPQPTCATPPARRASYEARSV